MNASVALPRLASLANRSWALLRAFEVETIRDHALSQYPTEACGLLLLRPPGVSAFDRMLLQGRNIAPRSYEHYQVDHETVETSVTARAAGFELVAVYHSHCNGRMAFSAGDTRDALVNGEPILPWIVHLVFAIALRPGAAAPWYGLAGYAWHEISRSFQPVTIELVG